MKYLAAAGLCLAIISCGSGPNGGGSGTLKTDMDSVSYAVGAGLGKQISHDTIPINVDMLAQGIRDAMAGKPVLNDTQMAAIMGSFQQKMQAKQAANAAAAVEKNKAAGASFLAENAKKPGVVTLPSGLQYQVITEGTGPMPKATDQVVTKYRGTTLDGKEFDASAKQPGGTVTFAVGGVIPGWTEALQKMKVGSKWKLWVPGELGYGASPPPGSPFGPNETLIFDIELDSIKAPAK